MTILIYEFEQVPFRLLNGTVVDCMFHGTADIEVDDDGTIIIDAIELPTTTGPVRFDRVADGNGIMWFGLAEMIEAECGHHIRELAAQQQDYPQRQSYADEHRLRRHEVL